MLDVVGSALADRGFGHGGPDGALGECPSFLFCTGAKEFATRWPETASYLKAIGHAKLDEPGACLDLVIEVSSDGALDRLDLEFVPIATLLDEAGFTMLAQQCSPENIRQVGPAEAASRVKEAIESLMPRD